ncbi:MAG: polysaccharide pyruvyl transferase family protein [Candidatus Bathyarchaeota archaeon]|nr:polysaccharide pyruvyl transferase family protein [Candidatus Bathyarchaeota archaeon]
MKVHIIGNINPLNNGWRILSMSVINFLSNRIPGIEFTKESLFPQIDEKLNPTCKCIKTMKFSVALLISTFIRALFWRLLKPLNLNAVALFNEPLRCYYEADVIIDLSGDGLCPPQSRGYWYSTAKVLFKLANLISIFIAIILDKKVILYSASIGNLRILNPLARAILNNVDMIVVRDYESSEYLRRIKVTKPAIYFAPDAAFSAQLTRKTLNDKNDRNTPVIGFNLSTEAVQHFHGVKPQHFAKAVGSIIEDISKSLNAAIILIPFSLGGPFKHDDDRIILYEVFKYAAGGNISILKDDDLSSIIDAISKCDILVTMRMHSAIVSLLHGVPPLIISHSPKFQGLIKLIGIEDLLYAFPQAGLGQLKEKILNVWWNRHVLRAQIERRASELTTASLNGLERMALMLSEIARCR